VDRGSIVKKGDLLVQLDPRDNQNALDEGLNAVEELRVRLGLDESQEFQVDKVPEVIAAKLVVELAERMHRRAEELLKTKAVAVEAYEQTATEYRAATERHRLAVRQVKQMYRSYCSAKTRVVTLQKALADCSIRAPFDGYVAERNISLGERVISLFPGAKLVTLLKIDPLRLLLTVPEHEMARVKEGQTVTFQSDAFQGRTFTGTIWHITPAVNGDSRSMCVEAKVDNHDYLLRPGLFVTAELQLDAERTDIFVPTAAVSSRTNDVAAVFVVRDGVVREQIVSVGEVKQGRAHIVSGLKPGDVVITTPEKVRDGDKT
jgi:RND family efflux transporter MFP subunit